MNVHITEPPHIMQHNFYQLVVSLQEKPEADAADTSLESTVHLGRLEITGRLVRLCVCVCVCVYKKQEWGKLTRQPIFSMLSPYIFFFKTIRNLHYFARQRNSNSSRLKISSSLTQKVEDNQTAEVKLKKPQPTNNQNNKPTKHKTTDQPNK